MNIKENLPIITALASAVAIIVAAVIHIDERILYSVILLAIILVIALSTFWPSTRSREQNALQTLATNNLLPNNTRKFLGLRTDIVIVGDKDSQPIFNRLRQALKQIHDDLEAHDFVSDAIEASAPEVSPSESKSLANNSDTLANNGDALDQELQKGKLLDVLSGADAVIVVRTTNLEKQSWVYDVVNQWAARNSNVPVLVIDQIKPSALPLKLNPIPDNFYFIPDHQPSLSWRLLKRANERSLAWRSQASFNRSIALGVLILLIAALVASYVLNSYQRKQYDELVERQKKENYSLLQNMYSLIAQHTKADYEASSDNKDDKLNLSYWISYQGTYYPLSSTETGHTHRHWRSDEQSIIGCALEGPNRTVVWNEQKTQPLVKTFTGDPVPDSRNCGYGKQGQRKLKSIVCASYSAVPDRDPDNIVGICMFTENENNNLSERSSDFIKDRTREFYESVYPLLKERKLLPQ